MLRWRSELIQLLLFPVMELIVHWKIRSSIAQGGVVLSFQFATAHANAAFIPPRNMELLMYSGSAWSIISGNSNIPTLGADPAWTITTSAPVGISNSTSSYALGISGGFILPINQAVSNIDKMVDFDTMIYPTIIKERGTLKIDAQNKELFSLYITDPSGQLLRQWQVSVLPGENKIEINAVGLKTGIYFLVIRSGRKILTKKFIKV